MKIHVEVFIASRILEQNQGTFSTQDIKRFIEKEFNDTRPGIQIHAAAACVANAPVNFPKTYNYLWRQDHGLYRVFRPGYDLPSIGKENGSTQPNKEDVPAEYRSLLNQVDNHLPHLTVLPDVVQAEPEHDAEIQNKTQISNKSTEKKSYRSSASFGKRMEYVVVAKLLQLGHDVYMTLVDDQQIDCVIRQEKDNELRYLDIQIKARSFNAKNPGLFAAMEIRKPRDNFFYIFYSESANMYWVIPSLALIGNAHQNKEGKNKGKYSITFANVGRKSTNPRPRFAEYENAFHLLEWK